MGCKCITRPAGGRNVTGFMTASQQDCLLFASNAYNSYKRRKARLHGVEFAAHCRCDQKDVASSDYTWTREQRDGDKSAPLSYIDR